MQLLLVPLYWLYQATIYFCAGYIIRTVIYTFLRKPKIEFSFAEWVKTELSGGAFIALILQPLSIFYPMDSRFHIAAISCILLVFLACVKYSHFSFSIFTIISPFKQRFPIHKHGPFFFSILMAGLLTLTFTTGEVNVSDSGLYHIPTMEWVRHYATIPGIGNLHDRFAFNNSSILNAAFFAIGPLSEKPFLYQNSFFFMIFLLYMLSRIHEALAEIALPTAPSKLLFFAFSLCFYARFPLFVPSISPDTIVFIFGFYILAETFFEKAQQPAISPELVLMLCFVATVKLSAIFIAFIFLPQLPQFIRYLIPNPRYATFVVTILLFTFIPYIARGYIMSGYAFYPIHQIDFFNPDWKLSLDLAKDQMDAIIGWARAPGPDYRKAIGKTVREWAPIWYAASRDSMAIIFLRITLLPALLGFIITIRKNPERRKYLVNASSMFGINLIWFFSAPDTRFGYAALIAMPAILIAGAASSLSPTFQKIRLQAGPLLYITSVLLIFSLPFYRYAPEMKRMLAAPDERIMSYPNPLLRPVRLKDGNTIFFPTENNGACWKVMLCTPFLHKDLIFRGKDVSAGFRIGSTKPK